MKTRAFRLLLTVMILGAVTKTDAEMLVFANGRTMSIRDYRVDGEAITVVFSQGGEATFALALVASVQPDEIPAATEIVRTAEALSVPVITISQLESKPFAALIEEVARRHGIDPALIHAVVEAESNYRASARSQMGARGLMQLMPSTARDLGVTSARSLFDPEANLEAGVSYLKSLLARFDGDLTNALAAYNAGPAAVRKYDGLPPFAETRAYVGKVLARFQQ